MLLQWHKRIDLLRRSLAGDLHRPPVILRRRSKRRREMELRRQLVQEEEDVAAIERQIAEARAKRNAKMEELVQTRNSYPVNLIDSMHSRAYTK